MILPISPDAPLLVRGGAAAILFLHIGGAAVGLVSGGAAMVLRKGAPLHRAAGNIFFVAMLTMSGIGAAVAPFLPTQQIPNTLVGLLTVYLVATGWAAVRRRPGEIGRFEVGAFLAALGAATGMAGLAWAAARSPGGTAGGVPYQPFLVFGAVAVLAAVSDLGVIRRGGVSGAARLTRHLWRMGVALLIAAGSFAGQPKAIPEFLRGSPVLWLPMFAVAVAMIYWLIRVRFGRAVRPGAAARGALPGPARDFSHARGAA